MAVGGVHGALNSRARFGASDFGPAGTRWFPGVVTSANDDGTFAVQYNDGDYEDSVLPEYIQSIKEEEEDPEWQPVSAQAVRKGGRKRPLSSESEAVAADRRLKMAAPLTSFADGHHLHLSSKSSTGYNSSKKPELPCQTVQSDWAM